MFSPSCNLSTYGQESDSDSPLSSVGNCSLALAGLRGSVSQEDRCYAGPFCKDFCKDVERDVREKEGEVSETDTNEGLIFNEVTFQTAIVVDKCGCLLVAFSDSSLFTQPIVLSYFLLEYSACEL